MSSRPIHILRTGRAMPAMGLGTWQLTRRTAQTVARAFELGYRMIDTSRDYGTQRGIAEGIKQSGLSRNDFYLVTKVEETDDAYAAAKQNLEELGTSYADLILIHRPPARGAGETLWQGLLRARHESLARDIGVSNYSIDLLDALAKKTGEMPVVNQVEWTPFGHSDDLLAHAEEHGIIIQAYSPLTRGTRLDDPLLASIAKDYERSPAQILIRWSIQKGTVPIPKANTERHLEENIDVFDFVLRDEDMEALDDANEEYSALGSLQYLTGHESYR